MSTWSEIHTIEGQYNLAVWHSTFPVLAASTENKVEFFSADGRKSEKAVIKKDGLKSGLISWHPTKKLLASSWSNGKSTESPLFRLILLGTLVIWNDSEQTLREAIGHHSMITCVAWSPLGQRLVTGDADGEVVVWRCDIRGRLISLCQYRLKSAITHCVFRSLRNSEDSKGNESPSFFLASANGSICFADDIGHCSEVVKISSSILALLTLESNDTLIVVNDELLLNQFIFTPEGKIGQQTEFKLSTSAKFDKKVNQICWVGNGLLALSAGRNLKIWDLLTDDSFNLSIPDTDNSKIVNFAYNTHKNLVSCITDSGNLLMWKKRWAVTDATEKNISWELTVKIQTGIIGKYIQWGSNGTTLIFITSNGLKIFGEQSLCYKLHGTTSAVQLASNKIILSKAPNSKIIELGSNMRIKSLALSGDHLSVCNGDVIDVFHHTNHCQNVEAVGSIPYLNGKFLCMDSSSVIIGTSQKINICNYQGTVKQFIKIEESDGELTHLETNDTFLLFATSKYVLKLYDISRREPKLIISRKFEDIATILSLKLNKTATFLSIFAIMNDQVQPEGQTKMLLYDIESDKVIPVDFGSTHHVTPVTQHWDTTDGRVFVTEVEGFISRPSADPDMTEICTPFKEVFTMFATSDNGIHIQDRKLINDASDSLIGSSMPFHFYLKKVVSKDSKQGEELIIEKKATKDFEGMEDADQNTIKATLDFSFYLSLGNMDEAFKCIHSIKNKAVWEHLAKMCVKTKRLDVAMMCLSNIGSSHTIRALREAAKEPEPEVQIGILAAYLGLLPDAENILSSCNRYDILNKLYQASGQWEKSLELSGTKDRINLRTAYHKFGKYLGEIGDVNGALAAFEKSAAYSFEVPRMLLLQSGELEKYINTSPDKNLKKWWAQFTESQGDYPTALKYYELAEDILSTVRVYCYCGKMQQAIELAQKTKNSAAAYHIARQYENDKKINEAIAFYSSAKCFNHAIRLAKEYKMENELIHLALQGSKESMLEVARYYETTPKNHDKAIHLFFKAGSVARAIDLCFQTNQFGILGDLCSELGKDIDPKLLRKCAAFFYEHGQFDKSVSLLVKAGDNAEALDICIQKNVTITEELANDMSVTSETQELVAKGILIRIADCCLQQRSFLVASKKYTQAGERMKAMKALLQSGDTEKIIFFANALGSKQKEIFVMVANYLQTLDWRNDQTVMKAIISFYTKAKALDSLATFYEACAQVEIDEYQDYEKGLSALTEAAKCLSKAKNVSEAEIRLRTLQHKMDLIKQFVEARNIVKLDPSSPKWVAICEKLLAEPDIDESGVKSGDIYAMMIETHYSATFYEPAFNLLQRMKEKVSSANIEYFLDNRIVQALDKNERKLMEVNDDIREDIREEY